MKKWVNVNLYTQLVIVLIALCCIPFLSIFTLLLLMPFGLWQVIGSIVFGVRSKHLEHRFRIFLTVYWIVLVLALILFFLSTIRGLYLREMHDFFIYCAGTLSILLGISYLIFSIIVKRSNKEPLNTLPSEIIDQI